VSNVDFCRAKTSALQLARDMKMTMNDTNIFFVGYRQLNEEEVDRYSEGNPPPRPYPHESQINVTAHVRAFVSSCNHLEADSSVWSTSGCKVMTVKVALPFYTITFKRVDAQLELEIAPTLTSEPLYL